MRIELTTQEYDRINEVLDAIRVLEAHDTRLPVMEAAMKARAALEELLEALKGAV